MRNLVSSYHLHDRVNNVSLGTHLFSGYVSQSVRRTQYLPQL